MQKCPKCGYERQANELVSGHECPECGIIYDKYLKLFGPAKAPDNEKSAKVEQHKILPSQPNQAKTPATTIPPEAAVQLLMMQAQQNRAAGKSRFHLWRWLLMALICYGLFKFALSSYSRVPTQKNLTAPEQIQAN